jgi:hypothetical protein
MLTETEIAARITRNPQILRGKPSSAAPASPST